MRYSGVIEGFYGRPWTAAQRVELFDWIADAGMDVYAYAPKDDVKLRARWRELYDTDELAMLARLVHEGAARGVRLMVAIAPCLDIAHADPAETAALCRRIDQLSAIGVELFALLFDDIPSTLSPADAAAFPSFAMAQCHVANAAWRHLHAMDPDAVLFFCPTEYCGRMAGGDVGASAYLRDIGRALDPAIEIFWKGPEVVSSEIPAASLRAVAQVLRRKPVIWENFHADDYDLRRVHAGPLGGRSPAIRAEIAGFLTNPNNAFEANFVPLHTTGRFLNDPGYDEDAAAATAATAWTVRFRLAHSEPPERLAVEEVRLLVDLFWQPFRLGPETARVIERIDTLLAAGRTGVDRPGWRALDAQVRDFADRIGRLYDRMSALANRDLFYAFQPHLWEVRTEIRAIVDLLDWLATGPAPGAMFPHEDRIANTYRLGVTALLQERLPRDATGRYRVPAG